MGQKSGSVKEPAKQVVKEIRRVTRRQFSAEEKIRIVLTGLRGEDSIAELCRREGIVENLYYRWSKEFSEAGKKRLLATPRGRRPRTRSRSCAGRPAR
jgi:transposase-like protein